MCLAGILESPELGLPAQKFEQTHMDTFLQPRASCYTWEEEWSLFGARVISSSLSYWTTQSG